MAKNKILNRLQKTDDDTNKLIDMVKDYLFSVGIRTSRERAWDIFQNVFKIPYKLVVDRNPEIDYQGQGRHISSKHGAQLLVVKDIGRFELKGVSSHKNQKKTASITFVPSADIRALVETVKVNYDEVK